MQQLRMVLSDVRGYIRAQALKRVAGGELLIAMNALKGEGLVFHYSEIRFVHGAPLLVSLQGWFHSLVAATACE
jgi:hypothetical protein